MRIVVARHVEQRDEPPIVGKAALLVGPQRSVVADIYAPDSPAVRCPYAAPLIAPVTIIVVRRAVEAEASASPEMAKVASAKMTAATVTAAVTATAVAARECITRDRHGSKCKYCRKREKRFAPHLALPILRASPSLSLDRFREHRAKILAKCRSQ